MGASCSQTAEGVLREVRQEYHLSFGAQQHKEDFSQIKKEPVYCTLDHVFHSYLIHKNLIKLANMQIPYYVIDIQIPYAFSPPAPYTGLEQCVCVCVRALIL